MGLRELNKGKQERRKHDKLELLKNYRVYPKFFQILRTLNNWTRDLSKLLLISYKEITNYLAYESCKFFQGEDMKCFKQLKAFNFSGMDMCKRLSKAFSAKGYCFVKVIVLPSMRQDCDYSTWISLVKETA